ncbi:MAG: hypothetical protein QOC71_1947, partial [Thermoplasmata archaeon]|nr:hypothetical protein [Thermoplasmata archaeon]
GFDRASAQELAHFDLAAGESGTKEVVVEQNTGLLRAQAMADGKEAELERVIPIRYTILGQGGGPADGTVSDPDMVEQSGAGGDAKKDTPALPLALLVLGCLAAVLVARRLQ